MALTGGRLTGFLGASAFRQVSDAANLAPGLSVSTFGWRARTNASYRFSRTFDLQTLFSYQAAMDVEQGRNAARRKSRTPSTVAQSPKVTSTRAGPWPV